MSVLTGRTAVAVVTAVLWMSGGGECCGITTHTEIGHRALHLLATHPSPAADFVRSTAVYTMTLTVCIA